MRTPRQVARPWATTQPEILDAWAEIHDRHDKVIRAGRIHATIYIDNSTAQPITEWNAAHVAAITVGPDIAVVFEGDADQTVVRADLREVLHLHLPVPSRYPAPQQFGVLRVHA